MRRVCFVLASVGALLLSVLVALPSTAAVAHAGLYFSTTTNSGPAIGRVNFDGSSKDTSLIAEQAYGVATHGGYLYWGAGGSVKRANLDGSGVTDIVTGLQSAEQVAVTDDYIFWTDVTTIGRANLDGSGKATHSATYGRFLAANSTHVYYGAEGGYLHRMNVDFTGDSVLSSELVLGADGRLAIDSSYVYIQGGGVIARMGLDGANVNPTWIDRLTNGYPAEGGIATDGLYLYWVSKDAEGKSHISRATIAGTGIMDNYLADLGSPHGLAVVGQGLATQTITFDPPTSTSVRFGTLALTATSSSGTPVVIESLDPAVCRVSGVMAVFLKAGTCPLKASAPASDGFSAAEPVTRNLIIEPLPGVLAQKCPSGSCEATNLKNVILNNIDISNIDFSHANMVNSTLSNVIATDTNFNSVNMNGVHIIGSTFTNPEFIDATLKNSVINNSNFVGPTMTNSLLTFTEFRDVSMTTGNFSGTSWQNCRIAVAALRGKNSVGLNLQGSNLRKANFTNAKLPGTNFKKANLSRAKFKGANVAHSNFTGATLKGTSFKGANVKGAKGLKRR